jgi:hypothetical protein
VVVVQVDDCALGRGRELVEVARLLALFAESDAGVLERLDDAAELADLVDLEAEVVRQLATCDASAPLV